MAENQMVVSDLGFFNINRKIINSRKYDEEKISVVGNVSITNNLADDFDNESYLLKSDLSLTEAPLLITISGSFVPSDTEQVAWFLSGDNPLTTNIILQFNNNQITLILNSKEIVTFPFLELTDLTPFKAIAEININSCRLIVKIKDTIFDKTVNISNFNISLYKTLYVGNDPTDLTEFWNGSLNVANFNITENNKLGYTPSTNYPFTFSKILISDGELGALTDSTKPVVNHILEFPINEVSRSNSTVLLMTQINSSSKLLIKEIGLYINTDEGEVLLSSIKNLNISKGDEVPYDLIFTVNISLNFVNVTGFPDVNSFVLEEFSPSLYKNFKTVQEVVNYVITNLERLVALNAEKLGYNQAQKFYLLQKEIEENEDCYSNIQNFSKLTHRLRIIGDQEFDLSLIEPRGDIEISGDGIASGFSIDNYPISKASPDNLSKFILGVASIPLNSPWEINASFTLTEPLEENTSETFATYSIYPTMYGIAPQVQTSQGITLGINNINGKNYCSVELNGFTDIDDSDPEHPFARLISIINENSLFEVTLNTKYYIKITYSLRTKTYTVYSSVDNEIFTELCSVESEGMIDIPGVVYIGLKTFFLWEENPEGKVIIDGVKGDYSRYYSNPFSGTVDLMDWNVISTFEEFYWSPALTNFFNSTELIQYYRIPDLFKESYFVKDICNEDGYNIEVVENSITGNGDLINFSNANGISVCFKVHLKNAEPKVLIAKENSFGDPYFALTFFNDTLAFNLFFEEKTLTVSKKVSYTELESYIEEPILITVTIDPNKNITMYKNNELLGEFKDANGILKNAHDYFITNYLSDDTLTSLCNEMGTEEQTTEEYIERIKNQQGRYLQNIIVTRGILNNDNLYYVNNLMDTNY